LANDVKQRMTEQMIVLLGAKGLEGASFSEVLQAADAPRGSLYHHFPGGKDQLVIAALELSAERAFARLDTLKGRPADEVARSFIAGWRSALKLASLSINCVMMAVTVAAQSPELRAKAGEIFRAWRGRLADTLQAGGVSPERAPALAAGLIAACEGGVGMARAEGSLAPFELMAGEQMNIIRAAIAQ
jgi:TetR/AcrR family transcriptional repressor of lmrAB and yxaGH operons